MEGKNVHEGNAAQALDRIRVGGANLILTAQQRVSEIQRAIEHGHFSEAAMACGSLQEKLAHLAGAQDTLGRLADASIVRVGDVEPGMAIPEAGVVTEVGDCPNCEREECDNVSLTFESGARVVLDCDNEICVRRGE